MTSVHTNVANAIGLSRARKTDPTWDYRGEFTEGYTHKFHVYPAMMLPQVARRLIREQGQPGCTVLDPFCGSGSVLVEAKLAGCPAWGIDLNPLAILIARAKTTPLDPVQLTQAAEALFERIRSFPQGLAEPPQFPNIDFWFKEPVIAALSKIKRAIIEIEDSRLRDFFTVAFSETARLASNSRRHEFKLYRYDAAHLQDHMPDAVALFERKVEENIAGMAQFYAEAPRQVPTRLLLADTAQPSPIPDGTVDLVVTSPPYGDSRTTVAYGQFCRLSAQWLHPDLLPQPPIRDRDLLGGAPSADLAHDLPSPSLAGALDAIATQDQRRAREVLSFYRDFQRCLEQITRKVLRGGRLCFVVGNRTVKGVQLPTDTIIAELGSAFGLDRRGTITRRIPSKRMPLRNSPTNVPGQVQDTMHQEHIVILEKTSPPGWPPLLEGEGEKERLGGHLPTPVRGLRRLYPQRREFKESAGLAFSPPPSLWEGGARGGWGQSYPLGRDPLPSSLSRGGGNEKLRGHPQPRSGRTSNGSAPGSLKTGKRPASAV